MGIACKRIRMSWATHLGSISVETELDTVQSCMLKPAKILHMYLSMMV